MYLNIRRVLCLVAVLAVLLACCSCSNAQLHTACNGIGRIETRTGSGTGFVVASNGSEFEVWTNGHVTGPVASKATVRMQTGRRSEATFEAVVAARRFEAGTDWAKLIAKGAYTGHVFSVGSLGGEKSDRLTGGFPNGDRFYSLVLTPMPKQSFGEINAYLPAAIPGQSGSPVCNERGEVVGVVTMYFEKRRQRFGGFLPIEDWKGEGRVTVRNVGHFSTLENAPPPE